MLCKHKNLSVSPALTKAAKHGGVHLKFQHWRSIDSKIPGDHRPASLAKLVSSRAPSLIIRLIIPESE